MRRFARPRFALLTGRDRRFYAAGALCWAAALVLMAASGVARLNAPLRAPPAAWRSNVPLIAGLLFGVGGAVAGIPDMRRRKRAARIQAGLCPACGYDLRASPERCPECGAAAGESGA